MVLALASLAVGGLASRGLWDKLEEMAYGEPEARNMGEAMMNGVGVEMTGDSGSYTSDDGHFHLSWGSYPPSAEEQGDCPEGFRLAKEGTREEDGCSETCCVAGWQQGCTADCHEEMCSEAGGTWIPKDYKSNPYTCDIPNKSSFDCRMCMMCKICATDKSQAVCASPICQNDCGAGSKCAESRPARSVDERLETLLDLLESTQLALRGARGNAENALTRGARGATDADMLTGWKKIVYGCHKRAIKAPCPDLAHSKDLCQASVESRSSGGGVAIGGAKCVWCENGCTTNNNNKCEPKNWLEKQSNGKTWEICPRQGNPYHTYTDYGVMDSDITPTKSSGGTGGHSKCYSTDSCLEMMITQNGWITSPRCTTCGRRRADTEYVTMNLDIPADLHAKLFPEERRRFHNPTFQQEEMQVASNVVKYLKSRDGRMCQDYNTPQTCALNADICIRMECDGVGFAPDWAQQTDCVAGFIRTVCK